MFNPLKSLGDLKKMRDQAIRMQQELAKEEIIVEREGVRLVMSGDQKIKELVIDGREDSRMKNILEEAIKKSQEIAARKLTQLSGGLQGLAGG